MDHKLAAHEEIVIKRQRIALIAGFVLFAIGGFLSSRIFGDAKYGLLGVCIPMLYLGISSIKNRISIARFRGRKGYARDTTAVTFGVLLIILAIAYIYMIFAP